MSVQTRDELAAELRENMRNLRHYRRRARWEVDAIRRRVPSCGNPPIHQTTERN